MILTEYNKDNDPEIVNLFKNVFSASEGIDEGALIENLVRGMIKTTNPQDIFGFVAQDQKEIIGCVFFTRLSFQKPVEAFILSPVAVSSKSQGKGIGQKLITFGLEHLKANGVELVLTYGDPKFYSKVGFKKITEDIIKSPHKLSYPDGWLCNPLHGECLKPISEQPKCVPALDNAEYW